MVSFKQLESVLVHTDHAIFMVVGIAAPISFTDCNVYWSREIFTFTVANSVDNHLLPRLRR